MLLVYSKKLNNIYFITYIRVPLAMNILNGIFLYGYVSLLP